MNDIRLTTVPRDLYYHEVAYVRALEAEVKRLRDLISNLSSDLTDQGASYSTDGLHEMRRAVANALPKDDCPDWLHEYRDADVILFQPKGAT